MARGGCEVAYDATWHSMEGAWFFPAHPGPRIRFRPHPQHEHWHHRHIGFGGTSWVRWRNAGLWLEAPQRAPLGPDWEAYFDEILHHAARPGELARLRTVNLMEGLLLQLAEARTTSTAAPAWLQAIWPQLDFASDQTWPSSPDYDAMARAVGWSQPSLRRHFKEHTGTSPHAVFLQNRMAAARRLLGETDVPIKEIAARLGYANVQFFARQFHQMAGVTPAAFRNSRH
jgi:AraC-like DNA-binding protein